MPSIPIGGRIKRLKQDLIDMKALSEKCPAIKFRTLDNGDAPEKYEVSFYLRTIIGENNGKPVYREATIPSMFIFDLSNYPFKYLRTTFVSPPTPFHPCFNECGQFDYSKFDMCFGGAPLAMHVIKVAKALQFEYISPSSFNRDAMNWYEKHKHETNFPCDKTIIPDYSDIIIKYDNYYWQKYLKRGY